MCEGGRPNKSFFPLRRAPGMLLKHPVLSLRGVLDTWMFCASP